MNWNKDNPRFRRSSFLGGRRKKAGLFSRIGRRVNGLFKSGQTKDAKSQRPHPAPPPELVEELKIALPKTKKTPSALNVSSPPDKAGSGIVVPGPASLAVEKALENLVAEQRAEQKTLPPPPMPKKEKDARPFRGAGSKASSYSNTPAIQKNNGSGVSGQPLKSMEAIALQPGREAETPHRLRRTQGANGSGPVEIEDDFKINRLGRVRRRRINPSNNERMEAGLGCDPKQVDASADPVCRPPRRENEAGGPLKRSEENIKSSSDQTAARARSFSEDKAPGHGVKRVGTPPPKTAAAETEPAQSPEKKLQGPPLTEAERKLKERRLITMSIISLVLVCLVLGAAAYTYLYREPERPVAKVTRLPQASLPKVAPIAPGFFEYYARELEGAIKTEVTIETGGSLGKALEAVGLGSRQGVGTLISYMTKDDIVPMVQPGDTIRVFWADRGKNELARLEYIPNPQRTRADLTPLIIMRRADGGFWHYSPTPPLLTLSAAREATIESSLWAAGSKAGLDAGIITSITEILASDIDFMTNVQRGDTFQVLYSRDYRDGRPKGEPIIDMIRLTNRGRSYEYYRYVSEGDKVSYFDPEGRSSQKAFFMTPLQYKRISSQFTMTRLHPIHKVVRPHQGVDYAAPNGTPVSTVADGTVIFCGWNGGYGKLVTIKHDETYTTMYAHLSKFASGITKGSKVRQGDLIGYVGATGTATGPHLDFRMKKHGTFIDPLPVLAEQKGQELKPEDKQLFIEKILTPLRDEMTKKLLASRDN